MTIKLKALQKETKQNTKEPEQAIGVLFLSFNWSRDQHRNDIDIQPFGVNIKCVIENTTKH